MENPGTKMNPVMTPSGKSKCSKPRKKRHPSFLTMVRKILGTNKNDCGIGRICIIDTISTKYSIAKWKCNRVIGRTLRRLQQSGKVYCPQRGRYRLCKFMNRKQRKELRMLRRSRKKSRRYRKPRCGKPKKKRSKRSPCSNTKKN
jgi:hypothetical protein